MKIISKLLVSILIFSLLPLGLVYGATAVDTATGDGADTVSAQVEWKLQRYQKKINRFVAQQSFSGMLDQSESQLIGTMRIQNNTRDGFTVHINSANDAILVPASTDDGEDPIPFELALSYSGETATQIYQQSAPIDNADFTGTNAGDSGTYSPSLGVLVLGLADTSLKCAAPTDMNINVTLDVDSITAFRMAGTYEDTLTVTYSDL
jgi:hypothetical protein